jgi:cytochrome bd-type quinol oxidase subunit 2
MLKIQQTLFYRYATKVLNVFLVIVTPYVIVYYYLFYNIFIQDKKYKRRDFESFNNTYQNNSKWFIYKVIN